MADPTTTAFDRLVSKFPTRYRVRTTQYLQGLLKALAEGDSFIDVNVDATRDSLFVMTASGKYLDRAAALYGIVRDNESGIQDDDFRQMIPILGMSPKQITHSIQKLIDITYGPYACHANTTCSSPAPFSLADGDSLNIRLDDEIVSVVFRTGDATNLSSATASEVAQTISNYTNGRIIAEVVSNTRTGDEFVNIRTSTIGSQGFIQVLGGEAQAAMRFPEVRNTTQGIGTWDVTRESGNNRMVYTLVSGTSPSLISAGVKTGDFVTIRRDSGFDTGNIGSFQITKVEQNTFTCINNDGVPESNIAQRHADDFTFFNPDLGNILLAARPATVLQTAEKELTVFLPVTSPVTKSTLVGSHHFHGGISVAVDATANTLTTSLVTGFPSNGSFQVLASRKINEGTCSTTLDNTITLVDGSGWPSQGAVYSSVTQQFYYYNGISGNTLTGVTPTPTGLSGSDLKYINKFSYTGISGNVLTGVYPDPSEIIGQEIVSNVDVEPLAPGSFLYDETAAFEAASLATTLTQKIEQGSSETAIFVANLDPAWPESGYFVLQFASNAQEGPVRYLSKVGTQGLIVDPSHVFVRDHLIGTQLRLVRQVGPYIPTTTGEDLPVYLTATSAARSLLLGYISNIIAAGITLKVEIQVPEQHWPILPLLDATNPLDTTLS